jgi:hypothetical protein
MEKPYFDRLSNRRIAVITYRKNVKDDWDEADFEELDVDVRLGETKMALHEKEITLNGHSIFRQAQ